MTTILYVTMRGVCLAMALLTVSAASAQAQAPMELAWEQLMPSVTADGLPNMTRFTPDGLVQHGTIDPMEGLLDGTALVTDFDGKQVRIPGYIVPLDFQATRVTQFLLVPYVGACIHVPPPPPNQIIFVNAAEGVEVQGFFEPVWITGTIKTAAMSTSLADVGYELTADDVQPYEQ